jgi:hypothetical protein
MLRESKAWLNILRTAATDIEPVVFGVRSAIEASNRDGSGVTQGPSRSPQRAKYFFQPNDTHVPHSHILNNMLPQRSAAIELQKSTN